MKNVKLSKVAKVIKWSSEAINNKVRKYREMCPKIVAEQGNDKYFLLHNITESYSYIGPT